MLLFFLQILISLLQRSIWRSPYQVCRLGKFVVSLEFLRNSLKAFPHSSSTWSLNAGCSYYELTTLKICFLLSKSWILRTRMHLFSRVQCDPNKYVRNSVQLRIEALSVHLFRCIMIAIPRSRHPKPCIINLNPRCFHYFSPSVSPLEKK